MECIRRVGKGAATAGGLEFRELAGGIVKCEVGRREVMRQVHAASWSCRWSAARGRCRDGGGGEDRYDGKVRSVEESESVVSDRVEE